MAESFLFVRMDEATGFRGQRTGFRGLHDAIEGKVSGLFNNSVHGNNSTHPAHTDSLEGTIGQMNCLGQINPPQVRGQAAVGANDCNSFNDSVCNPFDDDSDSLVEIPELQAPLEVDGFVAIKEDSFDSACDSFDVDDVTKPKFRWLESVKGPFVFLDCFHLIDSGK